MNKINRQRIKNIKELIHDDKHKEFLNDIFNNNASDEEIIETSLTIMESILKFKEVRLTFLECLLRE